MTRANRASGTAKVAGSRTARAAGRGTGRRIGRPLAPRAARIWRRVIGRDMEWLMLDCGHEARQSAGRATGRHAAQRACRVCERLERIYARWMRKGPVTDAETRPALRGIRKTRRPSPGCARPR